MVQTAAGVLVWWEKAGRQNVGIHKEESAGLLPEPAAPSRNLTVTAEATVDAVGDDNVAGSPITYSNPCCWREHQQRSAKAGSEAAAPWRKRRQQGTRDSSTRGGVG